MIDVLTTSRCSCCRVMKPVAEFAVDNSSKWGHKSYCLICDRRRQRRGRMKAKAEGRARIRRPPAPKVEPLWPLPTYTLTDSLDCIQLRKWRGPVSREPLRLSL